MAAPILVIVIGFGLFWLLTRKPKPIDLNRLLDGMDETTDLLLKAQELQLMPKRDFKPDNYSELITPEGRRRALQKTLNAEDDVQRLMAAGELMYSPDSDEAIEALDYDLEIESEVLVGYIANHAGTRMQSRLTKLVLSSETPEKFRADALTGLHPLPAGTETRESVVSLLDHPSARLQTEVIYWLGKCGDSEALAILLDRVDETDEQTKLNAIGTSLGKIGGSDAETALLHLLERTESSIPVVVAIGKVGSSAALDRLREIKRDRERSPDPKHVNFHSKVRASIRSIEGRLKQAEGGLAVDGGSAEHGQLALENSEGALAINSGSSEYVDSHTTQKED